MSYVIPSVLVYQQLASNAGVANVTPDLDACIVGPCYNVVNYVAGSSESLIETAATTTPGGAAATLSDNTVNNVVYLGSTKVGQSVVSSSVMVYLNSALVETKIMYGTGTAGQNSIDFATYTGTGTLQAGSHSLTSLSNPTQINVGDLVTVIGANTGGSDLTTTVTAVSVGTNTATLADPGVVGVTAATVSRTSFNNLNANSSTLRVEAGDAVAITYGVTVFNTTVMSVTSTSNVVTSFKVSDDLPNGITTPFTVSVKKSYNNLVLPISYGGHTNYSITNVTTTGAVTILPLPVVSYGLVVSGTIHIPYKALRLDLGGSVLDINNVDDQVGVLGAASDDNPLALGVQLALANTTGRIRAVAVSSDDLAGYLEAWDLLESTKVYAIVPLTQSIDILQSLQVHVEGMSTPENASWRIALMNTAIPSIAYVGQYNPNLVNANGGNNAVTLINTDYVLTSSNAQFVSDGVIPGDTVKITAHTPTSQVVTSVTVQEVLSNQQVVVDSPIALAGVNYYVQRTLTKVQQAEAVAAASTSFGSSRVFHIQPDLIGVIVDGVTKYLPGYYAAAAISGLVAGLPAQQSLTNIGLAGVVDLLHSNRYFTRAQLSTISAAGTFLLVQESAGTIPYIRHSLSTDMSVLQYREMQQVKNIDFLSYFFHDILKSFPGRYNITPDTLQILRTTIIAGAKLLQGKKLPKIGPPLLDYQIKTLTQDTVNKDTVIVEMPVTMPTVMNYINLYLIY
jgi:hypothetical protein